jgi:hypothetical protein
MKKTHLFWLQCEHTKRIKRPLVGVDLRKARRLWDVQGVALQMLNVTWGSCRTTPSPSAATNNPHNHDSKAHNLKPSSLHVTDTIRLRECTDFLAESESAWPIKSKMPWMRNCSHESVK